MNILCRIAFLVVVCLLTMASDATAGLKMVEEAYDFKDWAGRTKVSYSRVVEDYEIPPLSLMTNALMTVAESMKEGGYRRLQILTIPEKDGFLLIETLTRANVLEAQKSMIGRFANFYSQRYSSNTNDIGDRGYGLQKGRQGFALFTRNNILVHVRSLRFDCPIDMIARQIDADILRKSTECRWVRWAVGGLVLLGVFLYVARRRRARSRRTDVSSDRSAGAKKEARRKLGIVRVVLGFAVLLAFAVVVYSSWGRRMIERLVFEVGQRMAENSWFTESRN